MKFFYRTSVNNFVLLLCTGTGGWSMPQNSPNILAWIFTGHAAKCSKSSLLVCLLVRVCVCSPQERPTAVRTRASQAHWSGHLRRVRLQKVYSIAITDSIFSTTPSFHQAGLYECAQINSNTVYYCTPLKNLFLYSFFFCE